jgi:hypothetical protein
MQIMVDANGNVVFIIPFPLLRKLQLSERQIWGLFATFSLGTLTIIMSVVRFATIEVIHAWTNVCKLPFYRHAQWSRTVNAVQMFYPWRRWLSRSWLCRYHP